MHSVESFRPDKDPDVHEECDITIGDVLGPRNLDPKTGEALRDPTTQELSRNADFSLLTYSFNLVSDCISLKPLSRHGCLHASEACLSLARVYLTCAIQLFSLAEPGAASPAKLRDEPAQLRGRARACLPQGGGRWGRGAGAHRARAAGRDGPSHQGHHPGDAGAGRRRDHAAWWARRRRAKTTKALDGAEACASVRAYEYIGDRVRPGGRADASAGTRSGAAGARTSSRDCVVAV